MESHLKVWESFGDLGGTLCNSWETEVCMIWDVEQPLTSYQPDSLP